MSSRPGRRGVERFGIGLVAISLAFMAVSTATAHSGSPDTVTVTQTGPLTVQASGTWSWAEMATASKVSYAGYAIDWGDVATGNALGSYHIGDGTPATNVVLQPTTPPQGSSGSLGPVSHTYAAPGTYIVCVILYDLGDVKPFKATGYHGLKATGTSRNTDNSVDNKNQVPAMCASIDVIVPTSTPVVSPTSQESSTPFESFQGITFDPTNTPPATNTAGAPAWPDQGLLTLPLVLLVGSSLGSVLVFKTIKVRR